MLKYSPKSSQAMSERLYCRGKWKYLHATCSMYNAIHATYTNAHSMITLAEYCPLAGPFSMTVPWSLVFKNFFSLFHKSLWVTSHNSLHNDDSIFNCLFDVFIRCLTAISNSNLTKYFSFFLFFLKNFSLISVHNFCQCNIFPCRQAALYVPSAWKIYCIKGR